ncbi:MAG: alginate export family protein [Candidatus Sumerlaeaceae bacterium]|nr:alginate export family protein [Candidatus Sumerlaeaceae bacterium]
MINGHGMHNSLSLRVLVFLLSTIVWWIAFGRSQPENEEDDTDETPEHYFQPVIWGAHDEWKLQFGGDQRLRFERWDNLDLDKTQADNDDLGFLRTRLNFDLTYRSRWRMYFEVADLRQIGPREDVLEEAYWHINQLFLEAKIRENSPWSLTLGRQAMPLGEERLVSYGDWYNRVWLFDGVRLRYQGDDIDANFFVAQPLIYWKRRGEALTTGRPHRFDDVYFYGAYITVSRWKSHEWDFYALGLNDQNRRRTFPWEIVSEAGHLGTSSRYTVGSRLRGPILERTGKGKLEYGLEAALQGGHVAEDRVSAHMLHADIGYTWDRPWKPQLKLEGNIASGDHKPTDGRVQRFDPLFPTPYGMLDVVAQNLREFAIVFSLQPKDKLSLQTEYHRYWLDSARDVWAWGPELHDPTGHSGRSLGEEIALSTTYEISKWLSLELGVARFLPGGFARRQGSRDAANYFYIQYELTF